MVKPAVNLRLNSLDVARSYISSLPSEARDLARQAISAFAGGTVSKGLKLTKEVERVLCSTPQEFYARRQFGALVRKVPYKASDINIEAAARRSFEDSEARCRRSNRRLSYFSSHWNRLSPDVARVLTRARYLIRTSLGSLTRGKLNRIRDLSRPGGGVAIGTHNRYRVSPTYKYVATTPTATERAVPYGMSLMCSRPLWVEQVAQLTEDGDVCAVPIEVARGARVTFVPKDAKTLRSIAIEPSLNVMLQLGVHEYLRSVLHNKCMQDIGDQTKNQMLARLGSRSEGLDSLATVDLSAASDSISIELVRLLLPSDWFSLLDDLRSHFYSLDGEYKLSSKFSTMGNGFTFALETLLFWALAEACRQVSDSVYLTSVYGDDIIVPTSCYALLLEVFKVCGLSVNSDKSYALGPFRESCGTDWYADVYVTPVYLREELLTRTDIYHILNTWGSRPGSNQVRSFLMRYLHKSGHIDYGLVNENTSGCVFMPLEFCKERGVVKFNKYWQTYTFKALVFVPRKDKSALTDWRYLDSLLSGANSSLALRGLGETRARIHTPGVIPGGWWS